MNKQAIEEVLKKETPKWVNYIEDRYPDGFPVYHAALCPNCGRMFEVFDEEHYKYCPTCGQRLKWEEKDE